MPYDITDGGQVHRLQLDGREKLTMSGVEDVERFDDTCIVLTTCAGTLVVSGEALHIGKLSLDGAGPERRVLRPAVRLTWAWWCPPSWQGISPPPCWDWPPERCTTCCGWCGCAAAEAGG